MQDNLEFQLDKNLKLIERIKKYQVFFDKLEKDQKFNKKLNALKGDANLFSEDGQLNITEDDIKMGRKLEYIEMLEQGTRAEQKIEAKLNYYKNLKPRTGVFKTA